MKQNAGWESAGDEKSDGVYVVKCVAAYHRDWMKNMFKFMFSEMTALADKYLDTQVFQIHPNILF